MTEIRIDDPDALDFALAGCGVEQWDHPRTISLHDGEQIRAAVVYERFSPCDANIHVASDGSRRWMTRQFLYAAFAYPFVQLGLRRVTAIASSKNLDVLKLDMHLGFQVEGYCKDALPDADVVILGMRRQDCRFIPPRYRTPS